MRPVSTARPRAVSTSSRSLSRAQVVWSALIAFLTIVGGLLWLLEGAPARPGGVRLPALVATSAANNVEAIFDAPDSIQAGRWRGIVVHHSASPRGSADTLDAAHRGMGLQGLGYHFVIGNGSGSGDGELFAGSRWVEQRPGAHTAGEQGDWYNVNTIGICLVGDGDRRDFTPAQIQRLVHTVTALQRRLGIPATAVRLHRELAETTSPGVRFPAAAFREQLLP